MKSSVTRFLLWRVSLFPARADTANKLTVTISSRRSALTDISRSLAFAT